MRRAWIAALAVTAITMGAALTAAAPAAAQLTQPLQPMQQRYLSGAFSQQTVDRFTRDLAKAGIGVYRPGASKPVRRVSRPVSPMRLTTDQAYSAAMGAWAHAGMSGGALNTLAGSVRVTSKVKLPVGLMVAAWAKRVKTPSAKLARKILGKTDWRNYRTVVFPHAVTMLFASDIAVHLKPSRSSRRAARMTTRAGARPCTATLEFVDKTINGVFDAVGHVRTDRSFFNKLFGKGSFAANFLIGAADFLSGKVNALVDGARRILLDGVRVPIKFVTNALAGVAATVSVISTVANALSPWTGAIKATPNPISKGIGTGSPGVLTLGVTGFGSEFQWPTGIADCAKVFNFPLPTLTPKGADVKWDISNQDPAGLIVKTGETGPLNNLGLAQLNFLTTTETPEEAAGDSEIGAVTAFANIHRKDLDQLREAVFGGLIAALPDVVAKTFGAAIQKAVKPLLGSVTKRITTIQDIQATGVLAVRYHTPKEPKPGPKPSAGLAGAWSGRWYSSVYPGGTGTWAATFTQNGNSVSGTATIGGSACNSGGSISGRLNGESITFGVLKAESTITFTGTIKGNTMSGTYSNPAQGGVCTGDSGTWSGSR